MWALVYSRGLKLALVSAYIRHTNGEGAGELSRALAQATEISDSVFLGMDSNGHSPSWGPRTTDLNPVGRIVEGVLAESNLLVVNSSDSPATFRSEQGYESWIDVSAASPSLVFHIADWGVYPEFAVGSDHRVIMLRIDRGWNGSRIGWARTGKRPTGMSSTGICFDPWTQLNARENYWTL